MKKFNKKISVKSILHGMIIFAFFVFIIGIRFYLLDKHFTHYDDINVARLSNFTYDAFRAKFSHYRFEYSWGSGIYDLFYLLFHKPYNLLTYALNFSKYWTYAPGQFILTFNLLPLASDYTEIKFFGRFPSFIFGVISLFICWKIISRITDSKKIALFGTSILGFSWQAILYCVHMSNYESIILIGFMAIFLVQKYFQNSNVTMKEWIMGATFLGISTWFHYQVLCLFGGYALLCLVDCIKKKTGIRDIIKKVLIICVLYALIVLPLLSFANMNGKITWNAGVDGQYVFHPKLDILYICSFFFGNFVRVFKAMLSPVLLYDVSAFVLTIFYGIFFIYGIWKGLKEREKDSRIYAITIFSIGVILTELFFVFIGKFTLSPTRHCNVLIPFFVLLISLGIYYFIDNFKMRKLKILPIIFSTVIGGLWIGSCKSIVEERVDLFTEQNVYSMLNQCQPDLVVGRNAPQLWYLLPSEFTKRELVDYQTDFFDKDFESDNNNKVLVVSHTEMIDAGIIREVADMLTEKGYLSAEQGLKLENQVILEKYKVEGKQDFDFYNVTSGSANNFYYVLYDVSVVE